MVTNRHATEVLHGIDAVLVVVVMPGLEVVIPGSGG